MHYSENQLFGVTGLRHEFSGGHIDTFIRTRGKPAGFIRPWIQRHPIIVPPVTPPEERFTFGLQDVRVLHDLPTSGKVTVRWSRGSQVFAVWCYAVTLTQPIDDTDKPWPDDTTVPTAVLARGTDEIEITAPGSDGVAFLQLEPRAEDGKPGNPTRVQVDPKAIADDWLIPNVAVREVRTAETSVVTIDVEDLDLRITAVEYKKRDGVEGGDTLDATWQTAWTASTGTAGADTALQRVINVPSAAGLEGELQWRVQYTDIDGTVHTVSDSFKIVNMEATTVEIVLPYTAVVIQSGTGIHTTVSGYLVPDGLDATFCQGAIILPAGVTIEEVKLVGYRETGSDEMTVTLNKVADGASAGTQIVSLSISTNGSWSVVTNSAISELIVADTAYYLMIKFDAVSVVLDTRFRAFKITYGRPAYQYTY